MKAHLDRKRRMRIDESVLAIPRRRRGAGGRARLVRRRVRTRGRTFAVARLRPGDADDLREGVWLTAARGLHHAYAYGPRWRARAIVLPCVFRSRVARQGAALHPRRAGHAPAEPRCRLSRRGRRGRREFLGRLPARAVLARLLARATLVRRVP